LEEYRIKKKNNYNLKNVMTPTYCIYGCNIGVESN